jgi:hypothetical protein
MNERKKMLTYRPKRQFSRRLGPESSSFPPSPIAVAAADFAAICHWGGSASARSSRGRCWVTWVWVVSSQ